MGAPVSIMLAFDCHDANDIHTTTSAFSIGDCLTFGASTLRDRNYATPFNTNSRALTAISRSPDDAALGANTIGIQFK